MATEPAAEPPPEVTQFCDEADAFVRDGNPDEAIRRLNFALDVLRKHKATLAEARVLEAFARVHRSTGHMEEAEQALRAALACYLKLGDRAEEARLLGLLANLRISLGDLGDGCFWLQSSLKVLTELDNKPGLAEIHRSLAALHLREGELDTGADHAADAIRLFVALGDRLGEARTHGVFAQIHMRRRDFSEALKSATTSLELFNAEGHKPGTSSARMVSAAILRHLGRLPEAEALLNEVLHEKQQMKDVAAEAGIRNTLGMVLMDSQPRRLVEAEREFLRSIELFRGVKDTQNAALSQVNLAHVYEYQGRISHAETILRDAIKLQRRAGAMESLAQTLRALGDVLFAAGHMDEAEEKLDEAARIASEHGAPGLLFGYLAPLLELLTLQGRHEQAHSLLDDALKTHTADTPASMLYVLPARARLALSARDITKARAVLAESEPLLINEAPDVAARLRKGIDELSEVLEQAEQAHEWPLFRGYLPSELPGGCRQSLLEEMPPDEREQLSQAVLTAMQA